MKPLLFAFLMISALTVAQSTSEKDLLGTWTLQVDLEEQLKEATEDLNFFERILARSASGLATAVWERVEITFDFKADQVLVLTVVVDLDEKETEIEELMWTLSKDGKLFIEDIQNDKVQINNEGYWRLIDGQWIAFDADDTAETHVRLVRKE
jgi:hypothetical protein